QRQMCIRDRLYIYKKQAFISKYSEIPESGTLLDSSVPSLKISQKGQARQVAARPFLSSNSHNEH
ncbi:hypothetical protein, partial [Acinetobacter baumannii]|uniref:hypothetical protein n=1 Tax=Acinetobacter baumannii TaxID=470 RepID=UPI001BB31110